MRVGIACDHAGFPHKAPIAAALRADGHTMTDYGTDSTDAVDYPDYARLLGTGVRDGAVEAGVLICGSGAGAAIAANKLRGIRAALCHDLFTARQSREDDDANVLCLGARVIDADTAVALARAFLTARFSGIDRPARSAVIPNVVARAQLPAAYALWQILLQVGGVLGPALAGLLIAGVGLTAVFALDVLTFVAAFAAVLRMAPVPPAGGGTKAGLASIAEGLRFLRSRRELLGVFAIDLNAMVFGLPRALFPAMAVQVFGGGPTTYGLLAAAPGTGALLAALTTGWVSHVRRQGRAVLVAVAVWGGAMVGFGLTRTLWVALVLLAVAGGADVVSAVFRNTILQTSVPDTLRGRVSSVQIAVVTGGPRLGDAEAGTVAALAGLRFSVVSGGVLCVLGVLAVAWRLPQFRDYRTVTLDPECPTPPVPVDAPSPTS